MLRRIKEIKLILILVIVFFSQTVFAMKIVSLKPNITEILFAIGAGGEIVGVTTWCDKPSEAKKIAKVADYVQPNIERIIALKPDMIISSEENSVKKSFEPLRSSGIDIHLYNFRTIEETLGSIEAIGEATGHVKEAKKLILSIKKQIASTKPGAGASKVAMIVGRRPLVVAGSNTFLSEMVSKAGGTNVVGGEILYPHMNIESLIAKNPDVILDFSMGSEGGVQGAGSGVQGIGVIPAEAGISQAPLDEFWKNFPISAVKNNRVHMLDISDFRAGPDIARRVEELSGLLGSH